ncbi:hypothetical protein SCUCBS95973_006335 [Sporothrix curviconia]|uniref:Uncharacterized protein n=1 Tax=Sporothrix curviconia TaxID=1260050 RepID=A0ABP0C4C4_9PEZI
MPHRPAASQPAPSSTPDPSRFRKPNSTHARRTSAGDGHPAVGVQPAAARLATRPRFALSRQQQQQQQLHHQTQTQTQTPVPAARKFRVASARRALDGSDDIIEDGSSPVGTPEAAAPFLGLEEESVLVVRESPTATRTAQMTATVVPSKRRRRKQTGGGLEDDIEDVPASIESDAEQNDVGVDEETDGDDDDDDEVLMPDSVPAETPTVVATPMPRGPLSSSSLTRRQTSAARLLSSIQPLKRRKLFVPSAAITSSPPEPGLVGHEGGAEHGNGIMDETGEADEADNNEPEQEVPVELASPERPHSAFFAARFQRPQSRQPGWWAGDDDIVVDESSASSSSSSSGDNDDGEDIRDILRYGEMLEYGDSSEDDGNGDPVLQSYHGQTEDMDKDVDKGRDDEQDGAEYDTDMVLDATPPRVQRVRLLRLQRQQQQQQQQQRNPTEPAQRLPTFQRARMFVSARKTLLGEGDANGEADEEDIVQLYENDSGSQNALLATPARRRYYDALLHAQPPPDLFSPQKKRRRQKRKSRGGPATGDGDDDVGDDKLASPSAAAAVNAPEQYVPGGLAAGLRDWLVQIKSGGGRGGGGGGDETAAVRPGRFIAGDTRNAPGMCLALGRRQTPQAQAAMADEDIPGAFLVSPELSPPQRLLLAGAGRQPTTTSHTSAVCGQRSIVSIAHPTWEIVLGGQPWIVASDWSIHDEGAMRLGDARD